MFKVLPLLTGSLLLAGCAGMDSKNLFMDTSSVRPPPLPIADMPQSPPRTVPKPNIKIKREAAPPPLPTPRPAPPAVEVKPPHHWYDHLKFWQN